MTTIERPHGRAKYVTEHCGCDVCREANTAYGRHQARQRAYGRPAYIDAEPARAHLRALSEAGIGWRRAAELAGLNDAVLSSILYGRRNRAPAKRIRAATAEKILAVEISDEAMADKAVVAAIGTRRRLRALVAIGWTQSTLADRLGMTPANFGPLVHGQPKVAVARRRQVRALYDDLWNAPPAETAAARRTRGYAQRNGWVPPMAWDDDTIDDPAAVAEGAGSTRRSGKLPPADELRWFLEYDTRAAVARRFGVRLDAIEAALRRAA
jgi:transcriptional regulator with XRE-family HTH domain